ncbi:MAG: hypothetical protein LAT80_05630 [Balneolaceae bacterium]|nr:hypothetical protein [Balneolaceae bacterium]
MAYFKRLTLLSLLILLSLSVTDSSDAQTAGYEVIPSPDLWYNDVDGILLGLRLRGQVPGTFEDGPHRLEAALWLGTWLPSLPVSYSLSYTEPIDQWSDFGSEASLQFISSVRTGYHEHGFGFNKRWQQGFDERRYREGSLFLTYERRFDDEYVPFPQFWGGGDKFLLKLDTELQDDNRLGWYNINLTGDLQFFGDVYGVTTLSAVQRIPFNNDWGLRLRGFIGAASLDTAPEYLFFRSNRQPINWMNSRVTRAKGTIPQPWIESGNLHVAGGANLRGYTSQDIPINLSDVCPECEGPGDLTIAIPTVPQFSSMAAVNAEFDYFNPVNLAFRKMPYVADFVRFRSYLFFDAGRSLQIQDSEPSAVFANAGAGFSLSLNIPDFQGKPRGFVLRYEIPFWLSEPGNDADPFEIRHLFGFGAVISF